MSKNQKQIRADQHADADYQYVRAFQDFVGEIFRLNTLYLGIADSYISELDVATGEWRVMASIQFGDSKTVPQIARFVGISRQAVRQSVRKLESKGYVRLDDNPDHQRASLVSLTPKGRSLMAKLSTIQEQMTHLLTDELQMDIGSLRDFTERLGALRSRAEDVGG